MRRAGGGASPSLSSAVLHVFNLNQNQARLPGVGDRLQRFFTLYRINKLLLFFFFSFFFPVKEKLIVLFSFKARTEFYGRIFSRHPRGIELSSFFLPPLFLTKYVLDFYCLLGFFPPRASAIMLSRFVLRFSTGLIASDGDGVCFSFRQDLREV